MELWRIFLQLETWRSKRNIRLNELEPSGVSFIDKNWSIFTWNFDISFASMKICYSYKFKWERSKTKSTFKNKKLLIGNLLTAILYYKQSHHIVRLMVFKLSDAMLFFLKGISMKWKRRKMKSTSLFVMTLGIAW